MWDTFGPQGISRALERGVSVEVKYFTVSDVYLKITVWGVDLV